MPNRYLSDPNHKASSNEITPAIAGTDANVKIMRLEVPLVFPVALGEAELPDCDPVPDAEAVFDAMGFDEDAEPVTDASVAAVAPPSTRKELMVSDSTAVVANSASTTVQTAMPSENVHVSPTVSVRPASPSVISIVTKASLAPSTRVAIFQNIDQSRYGYPSISKTSDL